MIKFEFSSNRLRQAFFLIIIKKIFLGFFVFLFSQMAFSQQNNPENWSQFRGNLRDGVNDETRTTEILPETAPPLLWTKSVGNGFPEVVVSSGMAYIFSSDSLEGGYEYLAAIEVETGKELWKTKVDSLYREVDGWGHGPRSTPAIDETTVFCLSGFGKLTALSVKDGAKIWMVDLPKEFETTQPRWGFSSSPMILENLLILETGGTGERAFTAFDKTSGKPIWSKGTSLAGYNSPAVANIGGQTQIAFAEDSILFAYDIAGNLLWDYKMPFRQPTAMPVFIAPDKIFVSTVSDAGSILIRIENNKPSLLWASSAMQNEWSTSCYYEGYIYGISKTKLVCISGETGEMKWGQRGFGKGSLIGAGNKLIVMSDQGLVTLVDPSHEKFLKIGSFKALEGKSWTAPSFADGKLFVRNLSTMSCFKLIK